MDYRPKCKTIQLEEHIGENVCDLKLDKDFFDAISKHNP